MTLPLKVLPCMVLMPVIGRGLLMKVFPAASHGWHTEGNREEGYIQGKLYI